jgi:hypothetical protein
MLITVNQKEFTDKSASKTRICSSVTAQDVKNKSLNLQVLYILIYVLAMSKFSN